MLQTIEIPKINTGPFRFGEVKSDTVLPYPHDYEEWLTGNFPEMFSIGMADHHRGFWQWAETIEKGISPNPFVAIWPRGGGKSTNVEMLPLYLFQKGVRDYFWIVSETQGQADDHLGSIASILESIGIQRKINRYGTSRGWRRNRLWTQGGLIIDAIGLDTNKRGVRIEERRPNCIILDDVDGKLDTKETTEKKERILQETILPAGSKDLVVAFVQNLVIPTGVMSKLIHGKSDWLQRRIVSGPFPALEGLETENIDGIDTVVDGRPTWKGQGINQCQEFIDLWGLRAFKNECQHEVFGGDDSIFLAEWWDGKNRFMPNSYRSLGRYMFVDTAFKDKQSNDPSAFLIADLTDKYQLAILHVEQERIQSAFLPNKIEAMAETWQVTHGIIIEDKGSGTTTLQTLRNSSTKRIAKILDEFMPHNDKVYRGRNASIWCGRGTVLFPDIGLTSEFEDPQLGQLFLFPYAQHDDMVDTFTMAILYLELYLDKGWKKRTKQEPNNMSRIQKAMANYGS